MFSIREKTPSSLTRLVAVIAACSAVLACSSDDTAPPNGGSSRGGTSGTGGVASTSGGAMSGATGLGGATTGSGGASGAAGSGAVPATGGSTANGGTPPTAGSAGKVGTGGAGGSTAGSTNGGQLGTGGAGTSTGGQNTAGTGTGGTAAAAGSAATGGNAGAGATGTAGTSGGGGAPAGGSAGADITCPTGASFCSGFEGTALPSGTQFLSVGPNSPDPYALDTSQHFAGKQSLQITKGSGGFYYRALAVPVPGQDFWARFYLRVSSVFGDNSHDSLFGASTGALTADSNNETLVEFSEQFNKVLLNTKDQLFQPTDSNTITADAWHCIEAHYDGSSGDVQIFSDGKEIIHATAYAKQTFKTFRLGYMQYNDARSIWYDDVIVAPSRVNCE
jgi:hypothetical protein